MHTQVMKVMVPPTRSAPRGALWAADAAIWLAGLLSRRPVAVAQDHLRRAHA